MDRFRLVQRMEALVWDEELHVHVPLALDVPLWRGDGRPGIDDWELAFDRYSDERGRAGADTIVLQERLQVGKFVLPLLWRDSESGIRETVVNPS